MKAIQEWLGHSNFSTTANLYAHLDFDSKMESATVVGNALMRKEVPNEDSQNDALSEDKTNLPKSA